MLGDSNNHAAEPPRPSSMNLEHSRRYSRSPLVGANPESGCPVDVPAHDRGRPAQGLIDASGPRTRVQRALGMGERLIDGRVVVSQREEPRFVPAGR